jgi:hypothetical protein
MALAGTGGTFLATVKKVAAPKAAAVSPTVAPRAVAPRKVLTEAPITEAQLADAYLSDLVYEALLGRGEIAKVSEITLEIDNPRLTVPLIRRALTDMSRFVGVDRQWDLKARYLDTGRTAERTLAEVLRAAGKPLDTATLATELSAIYNRPAETYFQLLSRTLKNEGQYFKAPHGSFGLAEWLPLVDGEELADLLFDNELTASILAPYEAAAKGADWKHVVDATRQVVGAIKDRPVPHKVLGVLAWKALGAAYDPRAHIQAALADPKLVWLSGARGGRWITRATADRLENVLADRAATLVDEVYEEPAPIRIPEPVAVTPVVEAPAAVEEAAPPAEPPTSALTIADSDLAALERFLSERGVATEASELLALHYEVVPGDRTFRADLDSLAERLKGEPRFLYVGAGRFREPNSLPLFVYSLPEFLAFPDLQFVSMDGEIMDEEIEDEGFAGSLRQDVLLPLAQDAGDDEGHFTGPLPDDPTEPIRLVIKAHHKEIGTFPLCQIPDGFLPGDAEVVEIAVRDGDGKIHDIVVNHNLRLAYGFFGLYDTLPHDSGSVALLHRTPRAYEFRFEVLPDADPQIGIEPARYAELIGLREQAEESGDLATFDIACELIEDYPKGLDFVQLLTQVNVVRRVTRRKLASILSNYYCFAQKPGQGLWRFDAKKRDLGTDRTKRKYIKR